MLPPTHLEYHPTHPRRQDAPYSPAISSVSDTIPSPAIDDCSLVNRSCAFTLAFPSLSPTLLASPRQPLREMQARWDAGLRPGGGAYPPSPPGISSASPSPSRSPSPSPSPSLSPTSLQSATFSAYDEPTTSPLQIAGPSYNPSKRRSSQYTQHPTSITTPFTPTSPHGTAATQPVKIPRQALSPPTPAPSPTPAQRCYVPLPSKKGAEQQPEDSECSRCP